MTVAAKNEHQAMTEQEAQTLAAKLTRIWMPDGSFGEGASWELREGRFTFRAQLTVEVEMWFGQSPLHEGAGFHLVRFQDGQTTGHLYCSQRGDTVQSALPTEGESEEAFAGFARMYKLLMRANCFLCGCPIESSDEEQARWKGWHSEREEAGRGEPTHPVEWEVARVAAAFGIEEVTVERSVTHVHYEGWRDGVLVTWRLGDPNAVVRNIYVGTRSYCGVNFVGGKWEWEPGQEGHELMARGLYCLGIEEEDVLAQLDSPLSNHEKLELRLSLPRGFWPKEWLDGGANQSAGP